MSEIIESYKKVFENKKAHIWLFVTAVLWTITSTLFDIHFNEIDTLKDNPIDLIFGFLVGIYSLQFLHNAINNINNGILPSIKEIKPKIIWGMIKLNIVWAIYAIIGVLLTVIAYVLTHMLFVPIIVFLALLILSAGVYYIFLAFADNFSSRGLWKLPYIFKFIKAAYKPLYTNLCLFILITLAAIIIYVILYVVASLVGIDQIGQITNDLFFMDIIMNIVAAYIAIITWYFAFPYSLISSYKAFIKPLYEEGEQQ